MRTMMIVSLPVDRYNAAVHDGSVMDKMRRILDAIKPESAYFMEKNGERTAILIVEITEASQIPKYVEPWYLSFNAQVEMHPVMRIDDLAAADLEKLGKAWA
jgi:hypothetical protein